MAKSYKELCAKYDPERDFGVITDNLGAHRDCLLVAPHGGPIEPGTKEIVLAVAKLSNWPYYVFEGRLQNRNRELHISSTNFDEPKFLNLLATTRFIVSVHGEKAEDCPVIYVGGGWNLGRQLIISSLNASLPVIGVAAIDATAMERTGGIAARLRSNLTNRGMSGEGVQLEFTRLVRDAFCGRKGTRDTMLRKVIATAIDHGLHELVAAARAR